MTSIWGPTVALGAGFEAAALELFRGVVAVVTAIVISLGVSCNGFREDEIECEKTVIHLGECCPGFKAAVVDCSYSEVTHCDNTVSITYPAISLTTAAASRRRAAPRSSPVTASACRVRDDGASAPMSTPPIPLLCAAGDPRAVRTRR